jgi:hypothetical protein
MTTYLPRVSTAVAAWMIFKALKDHPGGGSSDQLLRWTGLGRGQLERGKRHLRALDERGIFICIPKGPDSIYILSEDTEQSTLYQIWMARREYRFLQSRLYTTVQTARSARGRLIVGGYYARIAALTEALAATKASLRQMGTEMGFTSAEIESWFTEDARWELDGVA